jgi:hypothetical protein
MTRMMPRKRVRMELDPRVETAMVMVKSKME